MCDSSDGGGVDREKEAQLQQAITAFMQPPFFNDICIRIVTIDLANGHRNGILYSFFLHFVRT